MTSPPGYLITDITFRKVCIGTYPFALGLGISYALRVGVGWYSDFNPKQFLGLSLGFLTTSVVFSLILVCLSQPSVHIKIDGFHKKVCTWIVFGVDFVLAIGLTVSTVYTCTMLPHSGGYYWNAVTSEISGAYPVILMGAYASVALMINT